MALDTLLEDLRRERDEHTAAVAQLDTALAAVQTARDAESKEKSEYVGALRAAREEIDRQIAEAEGTGGTEGT